jgi:hypothetical protein
MSKTLRTVATIAGSVALIATGVGAFAGAAGIAGVASAATIAKIGSIASLVSTAASIGAQVTAKKPPARGSITQVIVETEPPRPYLMGETFFAGVMRYRVGYGATLKKVPNPYLWQVMVYSSAGPVEALVQQQFDFAPIGSYYTGFYSSVSQLGARPEASALSPPFGAAPGWNSSSKLSGCAAIGQNFKFDRDGQVFASGIPATGAIWRGEKAYDPRLDSTRPGGSGAHRLGVETTYTYTRNPALHAGTYAYARFHNSVKIIGIGIPEDGIDWATVAAWANDCDANEWYVDGVIFEGGSQSGSTVKAQNLDDICAAGGGRWLMAGAVLTFDWQRPRISLETITDKDIISGEAIALQSFRDRFNTVRPQYRSPDHNWELITAAPIVGSTYVTEDGESKVQAWPFNLVKGAAQAGELGAYALVDSREIGPVTLVLGHEWRRYKPGDTLRIESDIVGLESDVVIIRRELDPDTLQVQLTFKTETPAKHDFALGKVAVPPPTPIIGQTPAERDAVSGYLTNPRGAYTIRTFNPQFPITPSDDEIAITAFVGIIDDGREISFPAETITGLSSSVSYGVFWNLISEEYETSVFPALALSESSQYVRIGFATTSTSGTFPPPEDPPPGWGGDDNIWAQLP